MCDSLYASSDAFMHSPTFMFDPPPSQIPSAHPFDNGEFSRTQAQSTQSMLDADINARFDSQLTEQTGLGSTASFTAQHHRLGDSGSTTSITTAPSFMAQHVSTTPSYEHVVGDFPEATAQIEPYSSYHLGRPQPLRAMTFPQFFDYSQSQSPGQSPDPINFAPEAFFNPMSPTGAPTYFNRYTPAHSQGTPYSNKDYSPYSTHPNPGPASPSHSTAAQPPSTFPATDSGGSLDYVPSNGPRADHDDPYPAGGVTTEIVPTHVSAAAAPAQREDGPVAVPPQEVFAQSRRVSDVSMSSRSESNYMSSSSPSASSYIPSPSHTFTSPLPSPCATSPVITTTSYVPVTYTNASSSPRAAPTPNSTAGSNGPPSSSSSSPLPITNSADPCVAAFLRERLGEAKFTLFTSRLFERRFGSSTGSDHRRGSTSAASAGSKKRGSVSSTDGPFSGPGTDGDGESTSGSGTVKPTASEGGTSAVEFLVKVEIVKEILRTYVPHPYNPQKSITYPFSGAPSGQVTLTRSTVLSLAGWSNTQFAYWARRAEAVSVLAPHDAKLKAVARALERRLGMERVSGREAVSKEEDDESMKEEISEKVTGKGLDAIIEAVKRRTGASQFLRGKHSSLDAFGSTTSSNASANQTSTGNVPGPQSPTVAPSYSMGCLELAPPAPVPPESSTWYVEGAPGRGGMVSMSRTRSHSMPSPWIDRKPDISALNASLNSHKNDTSDIVAGPQVVNHAAKNPTFQAERYRHSPPPLTSASAARRNAGGLALRGTPNLTISTAGLTRAARVRPGEGALQGIPEKNLQNEVQGQIHGANSNNVSHQAIISPMSTFDTPMTSPVSAIATEVTLRRNDIMFNAHVRPGATVNSGSPISVLFSPIADAFGQVNAADDYFGAARHFGKRKSQSQDIDWSFNRKVDEEREGYTKRTRM